jgi:hypothetical protein
MSIHYGFFTSKENNIFGSTQGVFLGSSTSAGHMSRGEMQGNGFYMYENNFRRSVSLFSIRSLIKSTWINSNDVYIGEPK